MSDSLDSAEQDQWVDLACAIRSELFRRAAKMPRMGINDLQSFICCCREALSVELSSRSYDSRLGKARSFDGS